jgi:hypothetical protein
VIRLEKGSDPTHVIVLQTVGAPQRRFLRGRRARPAEVEPDATPVATARVTVIDVSAPFAESDASDWLKGLGDAEQADALSNAATVVNRVLRAQRLASADPYVRDISPESALVARVGYGTGDDVADGRWVEALEVPVTPRRQRRVAALRPQERVAALLGARDRALVCEDLTLRARADLDAGRAREAALQLRVALEAGIAELEGTGPAADMAERVGDLRAGRTAVGDAANAALRGELDTEQVEGLEKTLGRLEAALRARSAAGFE